MPKMPRTPGGAPMGVPKQPNTPKSGESFMERLKSDKKTQGIVAAVVLLLVVIVVVAVVVVKKGENASDLSNTLFGSNSQSQDLNSYSRLNGELTTEEGEDAWVTALMIENLASDSVRPQPGLGDAGIVYETLAEGGITRFVAMFSGEIEAEKIGPIRSSRDYYLEFVSEYDALYGHMGGSPQALEAISGLGIKDLDGMYVGSQYYERDRSIAAPHNLFTSGEKVQFALRDRDLDKLPAVYEPWNFQDSAAPNDRGEGAGVTIDFSTAAYSVDWEYDAPSNEYLRKNGGEVHRDGNTNEQLSAMNVAIQIVPPVKVLDAKGRLQMDLTGSGQAYVLQNGEMISGTWEKTSRTERTRFMDESGEEVSFVRGTTWVEVVPSDRDVTFN